MTDGLYLDFEDGGLIIFLLLTTFMVFWGRIIDKGVELFLRMDMLSPLIEFTIGDGFPQMSHFFLEDQAIIVLYVLGLDFWILLHLSSLNFIDHKILFLNEIGQFIWIGCHLIKVAVGLSYGWYCVLKLRAVFLLDVAEGNLVFIFCVE